MPPHHLKLPLTMRKSLERRNAQYYDSIGGDVDLYLTSRGWSAVFMVEDTLMLVHAYSNAGLVSKVGHLKRDPSEFADYRPDEGRWVVRPDDPD